MPDITELLRLVSDQANDPGIWFIAQTAPEGYLQQELRRLHKAIEELQQADDLYVRL
ncbi:MAG: hypothetical protein V1897_16915 [Pseudomonadota bacterium]|uniref:Uncharacterized protein n=1 Tax=viral metagenome TaxID=1070528 RepID=A0A6M3LQI3_9ZZZZ